MEKVIGINQRISVNLIEKGLRAVFDGVYNKEFARSLAEIEFQGEILEVIHCFLIAQQSEVVGKRGEGIAVVEDIAGVVAITCVQAINKLKQN